MNIIPVISNGITDGVQIAFTVGANRAKVFEGGYHKEVLEVDGIIVIIDVRDDVAYIIIQETAASIFIHPRQGEVKLFPYYTWESGVAGVYAMPHREVYGVAGGWMDGKTALSGEYIYPMIDEDNASYELTSTSAEDENITGGFAGSSGNYGNLYWYNGDDDDPVFLSWKGTPTRHFRLGNNIEIDGFSVQETAIKGAVEDMPVFTAFGNKIYQNGTVIYTAPRWNWPYTGQDRCFVLGAMQDNSGVVWAMMQSDRYNVPKYVTYFSDGHRIASDNEGDKSFYLTTNSGVTIAFAKEYPNKLGIFTMLWKQGGPVDGWTFVAEWNTGRQGLPWFGNKSGTEFVNPLGSVVTVAGSLVHKPTSVGRYTEEVVLGMAESSMCESGKITALFSDQYPFEYALDAKVYGSVELSFLAQSSRTAAEERTKIYTGSFKAIYDPTIPEQVPVALHWDGGTNVIVNGEYFIGGAGGGQGTIVYSYNGFTVGDDGIIAYQTPCEDGFSAMGSVTATDTCGDSITREVRLTSVGMWLTIGWHYYKCASTSGTPCDRDPCLTGESYDRCKTILPNGGVSQYPSAYEEFGDTRCSGSFGCLPTAAGITSYSISSVMYFGEGGCLPAAPSMNCDSTTTRVPIYASKERWVCP